MEMICGLPQQHSYMYYMYVSIGFSVFTKPLKYSKTCVKQPHSKRPKVRFQYQLLLHAGQRIAEWEHSAILLTFI